MNLGFADKGRVLHEFGHVLGLIHENSRRPGLPTIAPEEESGRCPRVTSNSSKNFIRRIDGGVVLQPQGASTTNFINGIWDILQR